MTDGTTGSTTDGCLLVDKPAGMTSHDVVDIVRRAYGERSIGHLGTLDPFATGLLVLLLGRSTRLATFIDNEPKVYEATIRFGTETDTDDCTGTVTVERGVPADAAVEAAIEALTGVINQVPPAYSAKKVGGVRAYDKAREGEPLTLAPARVTVNEWNTLAIRPGERDVRITCGAGTYIRALARDLGRLSESAAHLSALRRTASGTFDVRDAATLEQIRSDARPRIRPLHVVVGD
jgi:tRNA pseudouridine55 synthase